jgi:hypothetical protein
MAKKKQKKSKVDGGGQPQQAPEPDENDGQSFVEQAVLVTRPMPGGAVRTLILNDGTRHTLPPVPSLDANLVFWLLRQSPIAPPRERW